MVTTLSDLIDMIERSTVPLWLRDQILAKSDVIDQAMRNGGSITLQGPMVRKSRSGPPTI
jgi:hypothetical protein